MQVLPVTDPRDPLLRDYLALTDVARRRRSEPAEGLFIAEGALVLQRALRAGYRLRSVLVDARRLADVEPLLPPGASVYAGPPDLLEAVTGFHVHRGLLAAFQRRPLPAVADLLATARLLLVVEDTNNPTNLGAVFRSAAAFGLDAVLLSPRCADPLYRRAVRVSMGTVLDLPYARLGSWPQGLDELDRHGFRILALTPAEPALPLDRLPREPGERRALLLGAEGPGLSAGALERATVRVRIPMRRGVDSLNVAAAAAVACWELTRGGA